MLRNLSAATSRNLSAPPSRATTPWSKQRAGVSNTIGIYDDQALNEEVRRLAQFSGPFTHWRVQYWGLSCPAWHDDATCLVCTIPIDFDNRTSCHCRVTACHCRGTAWRSMPTSRFPKAARAPHTRFGCWSASTCRQSSMARRLTRVTRLIGSCGVSRRSRNSMVRQPGRNLGLFSIAVSDPPMQCVFGVLYRGRLTG